MQRRQAFASQLSEQPEAAELPAPMPDGAETPPPAPADDPDACGNPCAPPPRDKPARQVAEGGVLSLATHAALAPYAEAVGDEVGCAASTVGSLDCPRARVREQGCCLGHGFRSCPHATALCWCDNGSPPPCVPSSLAAGCAVRAARLLRRPARRLGGAPRPHVALARWRTVVRGFVLSAHVYAPCAPVSLTGTQGSVARRLLVTRQLFHDAPASFQVRVAVPAVAAVLRERGLLLPDGRGAMPAYWQQRLAWRAGQHPARNTSGGAERAEEPGPARPVRDEAAGAPVRPGGGAEEEREAQLGPAAVAAALTGATADVRPSPVAVAAAAASSGADKRRATEGSAAAFAAQEPGAAATGTTSDSGPLVDSARVDGLAVAPTAGPDRPESHQVPCTVIVHELGSGALEGLATSGHQRLEPAGRSATCDDGLLRLPRLPSTGEVIPLGHGVHDPEERPSQPAPGCVGEALHGSDTSLGAAALVLLSAGDRAAAAARGPRAAEEVEGGAVGPGTHARRSGCVMTTCITAADQMMAWHG